MSEAPPSPPRSSSDQAHPFGPDEFARATGADRATLDRLHHYEARLRDWSVHTNLVAPSTLPDLWRRHFYDAAQLRPLIPPDARSLLDIGSGAGIPGLILALMEKDRRDWTVHLLDATQKKCRFLAEAAEAAGVSVNVHWGRAEAIEPLAVDVVVARAVAPLETLLGWVERHLRPRGLALLLKGARANEELTIARRTWDFEVDTIESRSDPGGTILCVTGLRRCPKPPKRS